MLPLWLLAAHMVGDFILATRWQAATKFDDGLARTRHVLGYCVPFVPIFVVYAPTPFQAVDGMIFLFGLHWLTDCQRFRSTLGDVIGWRLRPERKARMVDGVGPDGAAYAVSEHDSRGLGDGQFGFRVTGSHVETLPLPPNPWEPIGLFIDQGLHVLQLAVVGAVFLT